MAAAPAAEVATASTATADEDGIFDRPWLDRPEYASIVWESGTIFGAWSRSPGDAVPIPLMEHVDTELWMDVVRELHAATDTVKDSAQGGVVLAYVICVGTAFAARDSSADTPWPGLLLLLLFCASVASYVVSEWGLTNLHRAAGTVVEAFRPRLLGVGCDVEARSMFVPGRELRRYVWVGVRVLPDEELAQARERLMVPPQEGGGMDNEDAPPPVQGNVGYTQMR